MRNERSVTKGRCQGVVKVGHRPRLIHPRRATAPVRPASGLGRGRPLAGELFGRLASGCSVIVAGLVSFVPHGSAVGVAAVGWDGFGEAVVGDPDLPLVSFPVPGGFDQPVMVVAQQAQVP